MKLSTKIFNSVRKIFTYPPFEQMLLSMVRGSKYFGFRYKFIPGPGLYNFGSVRKVKRNNINYELDLSCLMQWYVYWDFKAKDRDKLYSLIKEDDIVFDVGTNIGETLFNFARLVGGKGFVYGFEPDEENYLNVQKNISLNNFKNVHVFKKAVSDKVGTAKFYVVEPHNRGMNRILDNDTEMKGEMTLLETTTLDKIVEENDIRKLDVIKIDIEGYEMHALRGALNTLKRFKPKLFVEVGYERLLKLNTSPNELIGFLQGLGYCITHSETNKPLNADADYSHLGIGGMDIVAIAE